MDSVAAYRKWAAGQSDLPLFHQPAWLDTVLPGRWQAICVEGIGWPFQRTRRWGFCTLHNPPLSHRLGPWPSPGSWQPLLRALPPHDRLLISGRPEHVEGTAAPLALQLAPSYLRRPNPVPEDPDTLLAGYSKSWRKHIRRVDGLRIETDPDRIPISLIQSTLAAGGAHPLPRSLLLRLLSAIRSGGVPGHTWLLVGEDGKPRACAIVVWDRARTYYLLNGRLPVPDARGAVHRLTHLALQYSFAQGRAFDFMGSRLPGVAQFNQGFGAIPELYPIWCQYRHPLLRLYARWNADRTDPQ